MTDIEKNPAQAEPITIVICDDEKHIREDIMRLIKNQGVDCSVDLYSSGQSLLTANKDYDIYFLDIQMDGINGMETAKEIRARQEADNRSDSVIIFVTALKEYMEAAFDVKAFHYLVKPVDENKFKAVFSRAISDFQKAKVNAEAHILIKSGNDYHRIFQSDILFIESSNKKAIINTTNGAIDYYGKMLDIENTLDGTFFRCHRCYIVNMKHITRYNSTSVYMNNGAEIFLAQKKYPQFVKTYMNFLRSGGLVHE